MIRRLLLGVLVVWGCSCGVRGHVPLYIALWINSQAQATTSPNRCMTYAGYWNAYVAAKRDPLRIVHIQEREYGNDAVSQCEFVILNVATGKGGCYRAIIDSSLRSWKAFKYLPGCPHRWWTTSLTPTA